MPDGMYSIFIALFEAAGVETPTIPGVKVDLKESAFTADSTNRNFILRSSGKRK